MKNDTRTALEDMTEGALFFHGGQLCARWYVSLRYPDLMFVERVEDGEFYYIPRHYFFRLAQVDISHLPNGELEYHVLN